MKRMLLPALLLAVLSAVVAARQDQAPMSNDQWKRWLDQVAPLMMKTERDQAKKVAPARRNEFRETFWLARNPDPSSAVNPVRDEFEGRILSADRRYRINGKTVWNDCGRVYLLLGKPDFVKSNLVQQHFSARDPMSTFVEQENTASEEWLYRNPPHLPTLPDGYVFRFNTSCEAIAGRTTDRLLQQAAASYVVNAK